MVYRFWLPVATWSGWAAAARFTGTTGLGTELPLTGGVAEQRFAIYTRQSAEPRDGLSSCEGQFQTCLDFARAAGWLDEGLIAEHFEDQGGSGSRLDRPALKRLRQLVKTGAIGRVCAVALDRIARIGRFLSSPVQSIENSHCLEDQ